MISNRNSAATTPRPASALPRNSVPVTDIEFGGMGVGDVKLLAGVGGWVGGTITLYAFCVSAIVGGVIALVMVLARRGWSKHYGQFLTIWNEMVTIRDPEKLAAIAAERKPRMLLLPYGIPIAIGTIAYFAYSGMLH